MYQCYSSYKSALTVYIYSFKLTSNKIHIYSSMCKVVVHSDVHLSSSVSSSPNPLFPLPNI